MSGQKVFVFAGTRPEIIKVARVVHELRDAKIPVHFCFTGQHLELALPFLQFFELEPDSKLDLMSPGQSLGQLTSRAAKQMDELLAKHPDASLALVQGDTTTAFTAALCAFYRKIAVGHIEAGLRTASIQEPFPEELNRRLITRIANWHYAPTEMAQQTLLAEKVDPSSVFMTGNTGIDALLWASARVREPERPLLKTLVGKRLALVTMHRRENIGERMEEITEALATLARAFPDVQFVLPVHKNPEVVKTIHKYLQGIANFHLTDPLDYPDLVWTMKHADIILSDSGGIQEEAPSLKKPVLVLRHQTERPEAVAYGTSLMVGSDKAKIIATATELLSGQRKLQLAPGENPYGDGRASVKIASIINKLS